MSNLETMARQALVINRKDFHMIEPEKDIWAQEFKQGDTHKALLIEIEEIEKK